MARDFLLPPPETRFDNISREVNTNALTVQTCFTL